MTVALGLNIVNGGLRWAVVSGTLAAPRLERHDRRPHEPMPPARLAVWLKAAFDECIRDAAPDRVCYRLHHGRAMTQEQVATFHYPWGILRLSCGERGLEPIEVTGSSLTAKRLGLAKGVKPMEACDAVLGAPRWDDGQRYAACAAWAALA